MLCWTHSSEDSQSRKEGKRTILGITVYVHVLVVGILISGISSLQIHQDG